MNFLNSPNFSLFCFVLNVWFALNSYMYGNWFMLLVCSACAALCMRNYIVTKKRY
jgi:multisubunit Na+/H+ antiporter MnhE subunit